MSSFIEKSDYNYQLRTYKLDQIIDEDDTVLDDAEEDAIAEVKDYLFQNYNTELIFSQTGSQRSKNVLRWVKNVVIYYIYERVPDELVPERVIKDYDDTIEKLEKISAGDIAADLPRRQTEEGKPKTQFRWGSQPARSH